MAQSKQQKEKIFLAVLLVVAALVWLFYFGKQLPETDLATSTHYNPINAEDYSVIIKEMQDAQSTEYISSGRNIFSAGAVPSQTTASSQERVAKPQLPSFPPAGPTLPPEVPPPQLAMKFFGYGTTPSNGLRRAFLMDGEEVRIVQEGDTIQNHIRITHIGNDRIEYEDTVTGKKNSSNLELPPAA
jgi:hypothetical protein